MHDLIKAFEADKDYYLQHLTLKVRKLNGGPSGDKVLEVIDGQQRLTTLALFFAVMKFYGTKYNGTNAECPNFTKGKLEYAIRVNVGDFLKSIDTKVESIVGAKRWDDFIRDGNSKNDEQDIYYIFNAVRGIKDAIHTNDTKLWPGHKIEDFYQFVTGRAKLIVNLVDDSVRGEEVFRNLNTNRVELTNAELVKALLLTQLARADIGGAGKPRFREVMERRAAAGRQWDEMARWVNRDDVRKFYFDLPNYTPSGGRDSEAIDAMEAILFLTASSWPSQKTNPLKWPVASGSGGSDKYWLFGAYERETTSAAKALNHFRALKKNWMRLRDWFDDTPTYNKMGYVLHSQNREQRFAQIAKWLAPAIQSKNQLAECLANEILKRLEPKKNGEKQGALDGLRYGDDNATIESVLLALSVFPRSKEAERDQARFDFYRHSHEKWSLEHVFPQTPEEIKYAKAAKLSAQELKLIGTIPDFEGLDGGLQNQLKNSKNTYNDLCDKLREKNDCELSVSEVTLTLLEVTLLSDCKKKGVPFTVGNGIEVHGIGNLALLTGKDNSSNSNRWFDDKRRNIVARVSNGSFVPKHTYDVFAKLFNKATSDLTCWDANDVAAHGTAIGLWLKEIKETLCK